MKSPSVKLNELKVQIIATVLLGLSLLLLQVVQESTSATKAPSKVKVDAAFDTKTESKTGFESIYGPV